MTIKRNQALVMKYIMQNYRKAAYVLDQPRDQRYLSNWDNPKKNSTSIMYQQFLKKNSVILEECQLYMYIKFISQGAYSNQSRAAGRFDILH